MIRRFWRPLLVALLVTGVAVAALLYKRGGNLPTVEHLQLSDGSALTRVVPGSAAKAQVAIGVPPDMLLTDAQLLAISRDSHAQVVQFSLDSKDCAVQQKRLQDSLAQLAGPATLVAGIGPGATLAWNWLAGQNNDQAKALSVDFSIEKPDCPQPAKAAHGHWVAAWNDNPDDPSAAFAREQSNGVTSISDYDTTLPQVLDKELRNLLQGESDAMPVVEVPAIDPDNASDTVSLFYSGDGGWRDLDRDVAEEMAKRNYPVVGIDALRYYWQHKSPEQSAVDLAKLMKLYQDKWGAKNFVLIGYSFGADVLPAIYNRLTPAAQQQVRGIQLIALARSGSFEIEVQGWLGTAGKEAATGPEVARLPAAKVLCVYGKDEVSESGCTEATTVGEKLELPGGHHFDEDYPALAARLIKDIEKRPEP